MNLPGLPDRPNIIIMMTDQQRALRDFPHAWVKENLTCLERLARHGMTYKRMYINTSPCWAVRAVMFSGTYPLINQVIPYMTTLPPELTILPAILKAAGYRVVYKGKWHLTYSSDKFAVNWATEDHEMARRTADEEDHHMKAAYHIDGWTSPDMGTELVAGQNPPPGDIANLGGGNGGNDRRVVTGEGMLNHHRQESALEFIRNNRNSEEPYCLVVSLVNPHDVSVFPDCLEQAGYDAAAFEGYTDFKLPRSYSEEVIATKPFAQQNFLNGYGDGPLTGDDPLNYLKFYAYLHVQADGLLGRIYDEMTEDQKANTIIIRMSDHGEMGMAHSGAQEKMNNFYEETVNVPLIISNPVLFPEPAECDELVSTIDLPTTIAALVGVDVGTMGFEHRPQGIDFSATLTDPTAHTQDDVLYTFFSGNNYPVQPPGDANLICGIVNKRWKYAVYFAPENGAAPSPKNPLDAKTGHWIPVVKVGSVQYELYDLVTDPHEITNLLPVNATEPPPVHVQDRQNEMHARLTHLMTHHKVLPDNWTAAAPAA